MAEYKKYQHLEHIHASFHPYPVCDNGEPGIYPRMNKAQSGGTLWIYLVPNDIKVISDHMIIIIILLMISLVFVLHIDSGTGFDSGWISE